MPLLLILIVAVVFSRHLVGPRYYRPAYYGGCGSSLIIWLFIMIGALVVLANGLVATILAFAPLLIGVWAGWATFVHLPHVLARHMQPALAPWIPVIRVVGTVLAFLFALHASSAFLHGFLTGLRLR